jgi:hypothetical protein
MRVTWLTLAALTAATLSPANGGGRVQCQTLIGPPHTVCFPCADGILSGCDCIAPGASAGSRGNKHCPILAPISLCQYTEDPAPEMEDWTIVLQVSVKCYLTYTCTPKADPCNSDADCVWLKTGSSDGSGTQYALYNIGYGNCSHLD